MERIPRIVLTGGPCAGKTTALAKMSIWCVERGYHPIIVPEAATILINSGLNPRAPEFQDSVIDLMLSMEQIYTASALRLISEGKKPVLIFDRGKCDIEPYCGRERFMGLLKARDISHVHARDESYDGVIFLQSAARGAEEFYSLVNNVARYESLDEARALDERTLDAWIGTPHLRIIDNRVGESFKHKIEVRAVGELAGILGEPEPIEAERGFHIKERYLDKLPSHTVAINIVQTYLVSNTPRSAERIRARGQNDRWVYFNTIKEHRGPGLAAERDRIINRDDYQDLSVRRDTKLDIIHKTRHCFTYQGQYCELDVFKGDRLGHLTKLEIETSPDNREVHVPPFLGEYREVTDDPRYSNYQLAAGSTPQW